MAAPKGYLTLRDAAGELSGFYLYFGGEPTEEQVRHGYNGWDFEGGCWIDELWEVVNKLPVEAISRSGVQLELKPYEKTAPGGHLDVGENSYINVTDGVIIHGLWKGSEIIIPKAAWAAYLKARDAGTSRAVGGRPPKLAEALAKYRLLYPKGHGKEYWATVAHNCGCSVSTIKRALGQKK
ncbi:MAG: hypothetical protein WA910_12580 [Sphingopyxis granuli]